MLHFFPSAFMTIPFLISYFVLLLMTFHYQKDQRSVSRRMAGRLVRLRLGEMGRLHILLKAPNLF